MNGAFDASKLLAMEFASKLRYPATAAELQTLLTSQQMYYHFESTEREKDRQQELKKLRMKQEHELNLLYARSEIEETT